MNEIPGASLRRRNNESFVFRDSNGGSISRFRLPGTKRRIRRNPLASCDSSQFSRFSSHDCASPLSRAACVGLSPLVSLGRADSPRCSCAPRTEIIFPVHVPVASPESNEKPRPPEDGSPLQMAGEGTRLTRASKLSVRATNRSGCSCKVRRRDRFRG